jgi:hypothetical protein
VNTAEIIAFTSLAITMISLIWNIFFGYAKMMNKIDVIQNDINWMKKSFERIDERFDKMELKLDRLDQDMHQMDLRVNTLEHRAQ